MLPHLMHAGAWRCALLCRVNELDLLVLLVEGVICHSCDNCSGCHFICLANQEHGQYHRIQSGVAAEGCLQDAEVLLSFESGLDCILLP